MSSITLEQVDEAMALKEHVTAAEASRRTGVSHWTIERWWSGKRDPYYAARRTGADRTCRRGHLVSGDNARHRPGRTPECRACRLVSLQKNRDLKRMQRAAGIEPEPILRYPARAILKTIEDYRPRLDALRDVDRKCLSDLRAGRLERITVDHADRMFIRLGLNIALIEEEPSE